MTSRTTPILGLITILLVVLAPADGQLKTGSFATPSYNKEIERWRASRIEELAGEDGWLSLVGLFWLKPGENSFGSAPSNDIVLPKTRAPRFAGSLWLDYGAVELKAKRDSRITYNGAPVIDLKLESDADAKQTILRMGSLKLYIIKRGEKLGLRVKDSRNPARFHFAGLQYFPLNPNWRVEAMLEPYVQPQEIPIVNVLGMTDRMTSPGVLVFKVDGREYRLEPVLEKGEKHLFIIFADKTTGKETYGAGRYLYADPPDANGRVMLDFNQAHNPPCAFTRFATCPLPPKQNRLPIRVDAGEKKYASSH